MPAPTSPVVVRGPGRQVRVGPTRVLGPTWQGLGAWTPPPPQTATTVSYVRKTGSDSNGGTSPADAWLTIQHALSSVSPGTAIYIGAGVYRETLTISPTPTSNLPLWLVGDTDGSLTGDRGMVQVTAYTTNDKTAPAAVNLINLNGKSNVSFLNLMLVGGNSSFLVAAATFSQNIQFFNCSLQAGFDSTFANACIQIVGAFGTPSNWLIDSCRMMGNAATTGINISLPSAAAGTNYDANITIRNSVSLGWINFITLVQSGSSTTFRGGGVRITNCFVGFTANAGLSIANVSSAQTTYPCIVTNSVFYGIGTNALIARTLGAIVEDYNLFYASSALSNVTAGTHSIANGSYAPLFHFGQESIWGGMNRLFGEPLQSSPLIAFGNDGKQSPSDAQYGPRPAGITAPATGAYERANVFATDASPIGGNTSPVSLTGFGYQDLIFPVNAALVGAAITISVSVKRDSNYTGLPPQISLIPKPQQGIGQQVVTDTGPAATVNTLTIGPFTPTAVGVIRVRMSSSDGSGISVVEWDDISITHTP